MTTIQYERSHSKTKTTVLNELANLCIIAKTNNISMYDRITTTLMYRVVVIPEKVVMNKNHNYHVFAPVRSLLFSVDYCYLVALEQWTIDGLHSRCSLYVFYDAVRGIFYSDNMFGEDVYWDEELEKRLSVIIV